METDDDDVPETNMSFSPGPGSQDAQMSSPWGGSPNCGPHQHVIRGSPGSNHSANTFPGHDMNEPDFKRRRGEWGDEWSLGGADSQSPMELT